MAHRGMMRLRHHEANAGLVDAPRATSAAGRPIFTPSAVSTSLAPDRDEAARLPCLATGTPQPATISDASVETL